MAIETEIETLKRHLRDFKQFEYEERMLRQKYEKALKDVIDNYGKISPLGLLEIVQKALKS